MAAKKKDEETLPNEDSSPKEQRQGDTGSVRSISSIELQGDTGSSGSVPDGNLASQRDGNKGKEDIETILIRLENDVNKLQQIIPILEKKVELVTAKSTEDLEAFQENLDSSKKESKKIKRKLNQLENKTKENKKKLDTATQNLSQASSQTTNQLAVFVAMFTFIAINFIFFATGCISPLTFLGLDLVLGGILIIFLSLLSLNVVQKNQKDFDLFLVFIGVIVIAVGTFIVSYDYKSYWQCQQKIEEKSLQIKQVQF